MQAALATANAAFSAARAIISGPGYAAAQASVDAAKKSLRAAQLARDAAIKAKQVALQNAVTAQNAVLEQCSKALTAFQTSGAEAIALNAAKADLQTFLDAESKLLAAANADVTNLATSAEYLALKQAQNDVNFAKNNTADLAIAQHALDLANQAEHLVPSVAQWVMNASGNLFNITMIELDGTLKGLIDDGAPMKAHVVGDVADQKVNTTFDYNIGKTDELVKGMFSWIWDQLGKGLLKIDKPPVGKEIEVGRE
jgi:hypothetical protein